ncbi:MULTISPECIES: Bax inhibitor-1/YccA family protein [Cetobacterium]|uniref:Bax inhibitor-1/YccA family protein n=1 Tax=Cetobacterium TaxID=180162 RepID=UPI001F05C4CB|nr:MULTISPECIES: Bax inhibitor-1/YccA family protein [Cetobacterium]MCX3065908.1 Bax inhibitor-1/YccA family protein [Cetobacterium somerae]UPO98052.1 Bax inhibitor-1/YccA family protein [Cetobacterium somerae]
MYNSIEISTKNSFLRKVFMQMFLGLLITGGVSWYVVQSQPLISFVANYMTFIIVAELLLVLGINFGINKISSGTAKFLFIAYSAMNGLVLSVVMLIYNPYSILYVLGVTSLIFVGMTIYGLKTKEDLSSYDGFFKGGLIALVIVSLLNLFLKISILGWFISVCAVVLFTALIAYDINRIVKIFQSNDLTEEDYNKFSTIGALMLYLDFVNLFLNLLRLFGKRNN